MYIIIAIPIIILLIFVLYIPYSSSSHVLSTITQVCAPRVAGAVSAYAVMSILDPEILTGAGCSLWLACVEVLGSYIDGVHACCTCALHLGACVHAPALCHTSVCCHPPKLSWI